MVHQVHQKYPIEEIEWEQIEYETLGGTIRSHMPHLGGTILNRMTHLGGTKLNCSLAKC